MDLMQQRYKKAPGHPSIDGHAVAKGWFVTVGPWLGVPLLLAIRTGLTRVEDPDVYYMDNLSVWPIFALASVALAMLPGLPLALLLDRLLRGIESPAVHVAAFLVFFTLLPAIPWGFAMGVGWIRAYGYSSLLGLCAAVGRTAAFRQSRAFRRPTAWSH